MKQTKSIYLFFLLLCLPISCNSSLPGCTDPMAANFDSEATEDDNSCVYDTVYTNPEWTLELETQISETSGLIIWDGVFWTINDDSDTRLYALDTTTGEIINNYMLQGVVNRDWEEISQDENFIYVGDIGNNRGDRTDLHILRINKLSLLSGDPSIDTIWFSFSDQQSFMTAELNQTEFDCEAFVVSSDSIYIFTKQWLSGHTTQYVLPKLPGNYVAQKRAVFDSMGQVTGATFLEQEGLLILCGYAGLMQPFLFLFYDYQDDNFFSGIRKRVNITLPFHQVEAVVTSNGKSCYISNESSRINQMLRIPPKLHYIDLSEYLVE